MTDYDGYNYGCNYSLNDNFYSSWFRQMKYCPNCGRKTHVDEYYCCDCGRYLMEPEQLYEKYIASSINHLTLRE